MHTKNLENIQERSHLEELSLGGNIIFKNDPIETLYEDA
jgi:hypothetical protein